MEKKITGGSSFVDSKGMTHYQKNKQLYKDKSLQRKRKLREFIKISKDNKICKDCGFKYPYYVMDYDHRESEEKLFEVSRLPSIGSMKKILIEIEKCDLVCSNCHRIRTYKRL